MENWNGYGKKCFNLLFFLTVFSLSRSNEQKELGETINKEQNNSNEQRMSI